MKPANKKVKPRWIRVSLRSLLVATMLLAVGLGLFSNAARRQQLATDRILASNGKVKFKQTSVGHFIRPWLPKVVANRLGRHFFDRATKVEFYPTVTDISMLRDLPYLTDLDLQYSKVTDFSPIAGLSELEGLFLEGNCHQDLDMLYGCTKLKGLYTLRNLQRRRT